MEAGQATDSGNRYCLRLGLPLPDLDTALTHPEVRVAHLMALAVLEAGRPLSLEAIAERLGRLALPTRLAAAGHPSSRRKAWHSQSPLVRDPVDGRFYLDLLAHHELRWIAFLADPLRAPATRSQPDVPPPPDRRLHVWRTSWHLRICGSCILGEDSEWPRSLSTGVLPRRLESTFVVEIWRMRISMMRSVL